MAKELKTKSAIITFSPHPAQVLRPDQAPKLLLDLPQKLKIFEHLGVDYCVVLPFSRYLSDLSPEKFLSEYILKPLSPRAIHIGYDFAFGKDRMGSHNELDQLKNHGIGVKTHDAYKTSDGIVVSSSKIRQVLGDQGNVSLASQLLGQPFSMNGIVIKGDGRGKTIGIPTANLRIPETIHPKPGVYMTATAYKGKIYPSMTNMGYVPTFDVSKLSFETHILDFNDDIYGSEVKIYFLDRIREEKKFGSKQELIDQLNIDRQFVRDKASNYLNNSSRWV